MPLTRGRSVRFDGLLHRDSFETGSFGNRSRLFSGLGPPRRVGGILGARAPVAQWIERWVPDPKVAGSSPVGRAITHVLFVCRKGTTALRPVLSTGAVTARPEPSSPNTFGHPRRESVTRAPPEGTFSART